MNRSVCAPAGFSAHNHRPQATLSPQEFCGPYHSQRICALSRRQKAGPGPAQNLSRYLPPGGHVEETDSSVRAAALREVLEETNIQSCRHLPFHSDPDLPFDIDTHEIPANPKKSEPKHSAPRFPFSLPRRKQKLSLRKARAGGEAQWIWRPSRMQLTTKLSNWSLNKLQRPTR